MKLDKFCNIASFTTRVSSFLCYKLLHLAIFMFGPFLRFLSDISWYLWIHCQNTMSRKLAVKSCQVNNLSISIFRDTKLTYRQVWTKIRSTSQDRTLDQNCLHSCTPFHRAIRSTHIFVIFEISIFAPIPSIFFLSSPVAFCSVKRVPKWKK